MRLGLIVEGHTEVQAVPELVRRWAAEAGVWVDIAPPRRVKRTQIRRPGEVERHVKRLAQTQGPLGAVLLVIDADDDPWQTLESELQATGVATGVPFRAVAAVRTFEAWPLAAKPSLAGVRGIRASAAVPAEGAEAVANGASRLTANMDGGRRYLKTDDAPALAARMDLAMARANSPSFQRFCDALAALTTSAV